MISVRMVKAFTIRTLIITGTGDQPAIVRSSQRSAAAIAGSRIELYEGAPHGLFLTDGERFNRVPSRTWLEFGVARSPVT